MAPVVAAAPTLGVFTETLVRSAKAAAVAAGPGVASLATRDVLMRRELAVVSDAQKVTLGIIAVYIVVIALLWNLPVVRWSLWPFKVRHGVVPSSLVFFFFFFSRPSASLGLC